MEMGAAQDFYNPDALPVRSEQRMNAPFSAVSGLIYINTRHRETEMPLTSLSPGEMKMLAFMIVFSVIASFAAEYLFLE